MALTQSTEVATVYTPEEIKAIVDVAHANGLFVHMDGARIANAAVALGCDVRSFTKDLGVDMMSFGGTKNGMMMAESVVVFNKDFVRDFVTLRKQNLQLASKMRFLAAQYIAYFKDGLWLENARGTPTIWPVCLRISFPVCRTWSWLILWKAMACSSI